MPPLSCIVTWYNGYLFLHNKLLQILALTFLHHFFGQEFT